MVNYAYIVLVNRPNGKIGFISCANEKMALDYIDNEDDINTVYRINEYGHTQEMERGVRLVEKEKPKPKAMIGNTPVYGIQPIGKRLEAKINDGCILGEIPLPKKKPIAKVFVYADVVGGITEEHEKAYARYEELVIKELVKAGYDVLIQTRRAVHQGYLSGIGNNARFLSTKDDRVPSWKLALADASSRIRDLDANDKHVVILLSGGKYDVPTEAAEGRIAYELDVLAKYADGIMLYEYGGGVNGADMFRVVRETKYKLPDQDRYKIDLAYNTSLNYVDKRDKVHLPKPVREGGNK